VNILRIVTISIVSLTLLSCDGSSLKLGGGIPPVGPAVPVTGVSLSPITITLGIGADAALSVTITPATATKKTVSFSSSNDKVVVVNSDGIVSGVSVGNAKIMVTTDDGGFTAESSITVNSTGGTFVSVTGISVTPASAAIEVGLTSKLIAVITPANATDQSVSWESSDTAVAGVDNTGLVTAVAAGSAMVKATSNDGSFEAEALVTVNPEVPPVTITVADAEMVEGDDGVMNLTFTISLSSEAPGNVDVDVSTADGSATLGEDYTALVGTTLTVPAGDSSTTVDVAIVGDTLVEDDETFTLNLSNPANAALGDPSSATGTIIDDDAMSSPPTLTDADKPTVMPCPDQDILTDETELALMQDALTTGAVLFLDVPFNGSDPDNFKKKCGFNNFWNPASNLNEVSPASVGMTSITLAQLLTNGNAGICTSGSTPSNFISGFPSEGTYRGELKFSKGGSTWHMRMRGAVTGSIAGKTFAAEGVSVPSDIENTLEYRLDGVVTPHNDLFSNLVNAFTASAGKVALSVSKSAGGDAVMGIDVEMICVTKN
jgi:hypothetical protein